jgi:hypothetical protein
MASGLVPSISIVKQAATFTAAGGVKLSAQLNKDSVCGDSGRVEYAWTCSDAALAPAALASRKNLRVPGPLLGLAHGAVYNFTLAARWGRRCCRLAAGVAWMAACQVLAGDDRPARPAGISLVLRWPAHPPAPLLRAAGSLAPPAPPSTGCC